MGRLSLLRWLVPLPISELLKDNRLLKEDAKHPFLFNMDLKLSNEKGMSVERRSENSL